MPMARARQEMGDQVQWMFMPRDGEHDQSRSMEVTRIWYTALEHSALHLPKAKAHWTHGRNGWTVVTRRSTKVEC